MPIYMIIGVAACVFFAVIAVLGSFGVFNGRMGADAQHVGRAGLPADWTSADLPDVRFQTALRGYRQADVDAVLDELAMRLAEQEETIGRLRSTGPAASSELTPATGPAATAAAADARVPEEHPGDGGMKN